MTLNYLQPYNNDNVFVGFNLLISPKMSAHGRLTKKTYSVLLAHEANRMAVLKSGASDSLCVCCS